MTVLSVNINKVALIRNSRGGNLPDVIQVAKDAERFGADGITVHPRPDERHITYKDVRELKNVVSTELNVEGYPSEVLLKLMEEVKPHQCTLVPDSPDAITSDHGWDPSQNRAFLEQVIGNLQKWGCRVSLFVDPVKDYIEGAKEVNANRVELYTGPYAQDYPTDPAKAARAYTEAAQVAVQQGLSLNAGHDLNLDNLGYFIKSVPHVKEVSIGHALISDAIYYGLENVIQMYKRLLISSNWEVA
jgi:pyridoxine 5-phosphate synthase